MFLFSLDEDDLRNSSENEGPVKVSTLYQPEVYFDLILIGLLYSMNICGHLNLAHFVNDQFPRF